jgi:hypothetical protein
MFVVLEPIDSGASSGGASSGGVPSGGAPSGGAKPISIGKRIQKLKVKISQYDTLKNGLITKLILKKKGGNDPRYTYDNLNRLFLPTAINELIAIEATPLSKIDKATTTYIRQRLEDIINDLHFNDHIMKAFPGGTEVVRKTGGPSYPITFPPDLPPLPGSSSTSSSVTPQPQPQPAATGSSSSISSASTGTVDKWRF